ncbi:MAG: hypothetical protein KBG42_10660 [Lachnospiraceae bacterium]|nr:hypothetical protein [Lachnospiraceae bacterium]
MVTCNCPNCGGTIKPDEDHFGTCTYCGTKVYYPVAGNYLSDKSCLVFVYHIRII